ncbi:MAG: hypothetical protein QOH21_252 [Acidobacteriota bacterium]|nr:hypothetical protein [Acidobacteriota bacterium]
MHMQRVESSVLAAIGHDPATSILQVVFRTGRIYQYHGVPRAVHEELLAAGSIGEYFNKRIRPRYRAVRVRKT